MMTLSIEVYITLRKFLTRLHVHVLLDEMASHISKSIPQLFITYDSVRLCLSFYTLVVLEGVKVCHCLADLGKG